MKIAVLGLGRMGQALAHRLLEGGHDVTVWNRTPGRADHLTGAGAVEAESAIGALGAVDLVLTSLANDDAVRELTLGADGVLGRMGPRRYVETSTISPQLSAELAERSSGFVALPILGAPQAVRDGQATYLAGGRAGVIDDLQPVLDSLGGRVKRYDHPETASTAKLAVNLLLLSGVAALAEALTVGRAGGLSDDQLTDLLQDSPMVAPGLKNRFSALVEGSGPTWWTTVLAAKDARLATELASAGGKQLRLAAVVQDLYLAAAQAGFDHDDITAVADLYR